MGDSRGGRIPHAGVAELAEQTTNAPHVQHDNRDSSCLILKKPVNTEELEELLGELRNTESVLTEVQLCERFFGLGLTGSSKPDDKSVLELISLICKHKKLKTLLIRGTLNNSVAISIFNTVPASLQSLRLTSGMSIDHTLAVTNLARAIHNHESLQVLAVQNLIVQCQDVKMDQLEFIPPILNPLLLSASSIPTLQELDLSIMVAHRPRNQVLIDCATLHSLMESTLPSLQRLTLTKLGLTDSHLQVLQQGLGSRSHEGHSIPLRELGLNDNNFTEKGIRDFLLSILGEMSQLQVLRLYSNRRLSQSTGNEIIQLIDTSSAPPSTGTLATVQPVSPLRSLELNVPCVCQIELDYHLSLNQIGGPSILSAKLTNVDCVNALVTSRGNLSVLLDVLRTHPAICANVRHAEEYQIVAPMPEPPTMFRTPELSLSKKTTKRGQRQSASQRPNSGPGRTKTAPIGACILQTPWQSKHEYVSPTAVIDVSLAELSIASRQTRISAGQNYPAVASLEKNDDDESQGSIELNDNDGYERESSRRPSHANLNASYSSLPHFRRKVRRKWRRSRSMSHALDDHSDSSKGDIPAISTSHRTRRREVGNKSTSTARKKSSSLPNKLIQSQVSDDS